MESLIPYITYTNYHRKSKAIGDIDPANDMMRYIADRFELNIEQRYWLAFLYSTCYCGATVFYIYNEFPDFENVDVPRLQRWWDKNKHLLVFQTDRLRIKSNDQFVETFESYKKWVGPISQNLRFRRLDTGDKIHNYKVLFSELGKIKNVGRFTLFIYIEMITVLTGHPTEPDTLDLKEAGACRKGLLHALDLPLDYTDWPHLNRELLRLKSVLKDSLYSIETTLCAYGKYMEDRRYIGYYIERQGKEIIKLQSYKETSGVCWKVLHQFREETYKPIYLKQKTLNV